MNKPERSLDDAIARLPLWAQDEILKSIDELEMWASFHPTRDIGPDIPIPCSREGLSKGWTFNEYRAMESPVNSVSKACSSSNLHGSGWDDTSTQRPIPLFSSRLLALKACRRAAERKTAKLLQKFDALIAEEIAKPTPGPQEAP